MFSATSGAAHPTIACSKAQAKIYGSGVTLNLLVCRMRNDALDPLEANDCAIGALVHGFVR